MLKKWITTQDCAAITVEEKYVTHAATNHTDRYVTAGPTVS